MKPIFVLVLILVALGRCSKKDNIALDSDEKKYSYVIGHQIGQSMKAQNLNIDVDVLRMALNDVMTNKASRITPEEMRTAMQNVQAKMLADRRQSQQKDGSANDEKGKAFLEENKKKDGVKVTNSGLQYQVLTAGKGKTPKATDMVKVHYKGTLIDGTEFDSSIKRGEPTTFKVGQVIPGWTEALQMMKEGDKWKLAIPANLAYGLESPPSIPPNSVLVFEVELLEVLSGKAGKPAAKSASAKTKKK